MFGENDPSVKIATASKAGLVPTPPNDSTQVLLGNATWGAPPLPSTTSVLSNTSGSVTPNASGNWYSGSATITLTPGTWLINGLVCGFNQGGSAAFSNLSYVFSIADGANNNTQPTAISTTGNVTLKAGQANFNNGFVTSPPGVAGTPCSLASEPILVAVSANTQIFCVPNASMGTASFARIKSDIWALKVSSATS